MSKKPEFILASYVTYKELYKCEKYRSQYQILAEFIKYAIYEKKLYQFSSIEIRKIVEDLFGFKVPNAVIKTALKKTDCVYKLDTQDAYGVDQEMIKIDTSFKKYKNSAEQYNSQLIDLLCEFTEKRIGRKLSEDEIQKLSTDFMAYLLDESNGGSYQDSISTFILYYANDEEVVKQLDSIREGCILYTGINYNIDKTGNVTNELTLYLDMEVLFDLYGYNGDVFQCLAQDMINMIKEANAKKKYISLRYFQDTKREIEDFFGKAEDIVLGKMLLKENVAMKAITDGCADATDVSDRKSDFFHKMQYLYGIVEDPVKEYYKLEQYEANLEGMEFGEINDVDINSFEQSIKFVSNINKLRKNKHFSDYFKSQYIFVTETRKTLDISKMFTTRLGSKTDGEYQYAGFAVNMGFLTNLLWYKLNKGFGKNEYPQNMNAVVKAKIVLSNYISQSIAYTYEECKEEYEQGKITDEQFAARILALRSRNVRPEEITIDTVEDDLNFNPENIKRFEEESKWQKVKLAEKNEELEQMRMNYSKIMQEIENVQCKLNESVKERDKQSDILCNQEKAIMQQNRIIEQQNEIIEKYQNKEEEKLKKWKKTKQIIKFSASILITIVVMAILAIGIYLITGKIKEDYVTSISIVVTVIGIVLSIPNIVKYLYKKYFLSMEVDEIK